MKVSLVDTHTHIYYHTGTVELSMQMARCFEKGIDRLILPNVDLDSIPLIDQTLQEYPENCFAMLGLHPCSVKENYQEVLSQIESYISDRKIVAIGEIGLDLYWDTSLFKEQAQAFRTQLKWAKELKLPVSIHCRQAFNELIPILEDEQDGRLTGVLHCFTGNLEEAKKISDLGLYLGIGGVVTYKNSGLDRVVQNLSLSQIVLETDSPYLAPSPFRGKSNESSYMHITAQKIADIHATTLEDVAQATTNNAEKIFNLQFVNN